jgi:hypothetical protein
MQWGMKREEARWRRENRLGGRLLGVRFLPVFDWNDPIECYWSIRPFGSSCMRARCQGAGMAKLAIVKPSPSTSGRPTSTAKDWAGQPLMAHPVP